MDDSTEIPDGEIAMICTNEKKNSIYDSTENPDGEITAACTNLIEPLNLWRRERIAGMKINVFSVVSKT